MNGLKCIVIRPYIFILTFYVDDGVAYRSRLWGRKFKYTAVRIFGLSGWRKWLGRHNCRWYLTNDTFWGTFDLRQWHYCTSYPHYTHKTHFSPHYLSMNTSYLVVFWSSGTRNRHKRSHLFLFVSNSIKSVVWIGGWVSLWRNQVRIRSSYQTKLRFKP